MEIDFRAIAHAMKDKGHAWDGDHMPGYSADLLDVMEDLYGLEHEVTNELEELENEKLPNNQ